MQEVLVLDIGLLLRLAVNLDGNIAVDRGAVAETAVRICPPTIRDTAHREPASVVGAGADGSEPEATRDYNRRPTHVRRAIAELAEHVIPPTVRSAGGGDPTSLDTA